MSSQRVCRANLHNSGEVGGRVCVCRVKAVERRNKNKELSCFSIVSFPKMAKLIMEDIKVSGEVKCKENVGVE